MEKGTDPAVIERTWTMQLVIMANEALDLQDEANRRELASHRKDGG